MEFNKVFFQPLTGVILLWVVFSNISCTKKKRPCTDHYFVFAECVVIPLKYEYKVGDTITLSLTLDDRMKDIITDTELDIASMEPRPAIFSVLAWPVPRSNDKPYGPGYDSFKIVTNNSISVQNLGRIATFSRVNSKFKIEIKMIPQKKGFYSTGFGGSSFKVSSPECRHQYGVKSVNGISNFELPNLRGYNVDPPSEMGFIYWFDVK